MVGRLAKPSEPIPVVQEGDDTMTRNLEKTVADTKKFTEQLEQLDKTSLIYALGYTNYLLLCAQTGNKSA